MQTTAELREGFLSFFEEKGHLRVPSASLVPRADDRSTLLTSAGMQPQMPYFLGLEDPPAPLTTTTQKVFRTPDIEEVGLDTYHLTFFEMLGNFSFGQYFKEGAVEFATEFMLERMQLDWDRIWASVHAGDPQLGLGPDEVTIELWKKVGMPARADRAAAERGELLVGRRAGAVRSRLRALLGLGRGDRLRERRLRARLHALRALPRVLEPRLHGVRAARGRHAHTASEAEHRHGMGLERGARILQNVPSVFETDGFRQIMDWIAAESGVAYGDSPEATKAHRILADHSRGMTFLVGDGVTPSNEGRGYVLRRIVRRAIVQARRIGLAGRLPADRGRRRADGPRVPGAPGARDRDRAGRSGPRRSASGRRSSAG